jgi:anion-transporting  ArsA/GET3 family ATPase
MSLFDRRLLVVSGKGGVGKSTVAAALAVAAARRGRRVLVADVSGGDRLERLFDSDEPIGHRRTPVHQGVDAMSVDPQRALEDYLLGGVPARALIQKVLESRVITMFAAATPGLRELLALGTVTAMLEPGGDGRRAYDVVVVDAPATGHGVGMLRVPRTFADLVTTGPLSARAERLSGLVEDPGQTGVVLVATPEELPVSEALEARDELAQRAIPLAGIVANAVYPPLFDEAEAAELRAVQANGLAAAALRAAASRAARTQDQQAQLARLGDVLATLPFLFEARMDAAAVARLSGELDRL